MSCISFHSSLPQLKVVKMQKTEYSISAFQEYLARCDLMGFAVILFERLPSQVFEFKTISPVLEPIAASDLFSKKRAENTFPP